jgi:hypothetical protein
MSDSFLPSVGMPPEIHHGCDDHHVLLHRVDQSIWKPACSTAAVVLRYPSPSLGVKQDAVHSPLDLIEEIQTQSRRHALVVLDGLRQLLLRGRKKSVGHLM